MFEWLNELLTLRIAYLERKRKLEIDYLAEKIQLDNEERDLELKVFDAENTCETCEVLKLELAKAHDENHRLIGIITTKPEVEERPTIENLRPILPTRHMPFHARRQMMEQEDRARARIIRDNEEANKETVKDETLTAALEKELNIVETEREAESGVRE